jgi:hypothetical protein
VFYAGGDVEKPALTGAWRVSPNGEKTPLWGEVFAESSLSAKPFAGPGAGGPGLAAAGGAVENQGWEKDDRLELQFSRAVDSLSVKNKLSAEGAPGLAEETPPSFSQTAFFRFEKPPAYESRFSIRLKAGIKDAAGNESAEDHVFKIFANGLHSRPPALLGMRIPVSPSLAPANPRSYAPDDLFADLPLDSADYPYATAKAAWIELYFDAAEGAAIDPLSVMELFRVDSSNNALAFSPRSVRAEGFTMSDPEPLWEKYQRLEIGGYLTNRVNGGVVHFEIAAGLRDSFGNSSEKSFKISLLK